MRMMKCAVTIGLLALSGALGFAPNAGATTSQAGTSCQPYNAHWQVCTRTYFDHGTNKWEKEVFLAPRDGQYDTIDP
jgi:hypothetical protein